MGLKLVSDLLSGATSVFGFEFEPVPDRRIVAGSNDRRARSMVMQHIKANHRRWCRIIFEDAWLASRFSGTEPLLRIYAEAGRPETVEALLDAAVEYLGV